MLAANSDIALINKCPHKDLINFFRFLFDYGLLVNDTLAYNLALLGAGISGQGLKSVMGDISNIINPDAKSPEDVLDSNLPGLMKELENTIVTFDRESMRRIRADIKREKMTI